jgi:hypothetical protein
MFKFNVYKNNEKVYTSNNCKDCNEFIDAMLEEENLSYSNNPYWIEDEEEEAEGARIKEEMGL